MDKNLKTLVAASSLVAASFFLLGSFGTVTAKKYDKDWENCSSDTECIVVDNPCLGAPALTINKKFEEAYDTYFEIRRNSVTCSPVQTRKSTAAETTPPSETQPVAVCSAGTRKCEVRYVPE